MTETVSYDRLSAMEDGQGGHCRSEIKNSVSARVLFTEAAWQYTQAGGDAHHLVGLCMLLQGRYLDEIDQGFIEGVASHTCRGVSNSTANRRVYTPISAVLKFSARHGWCKKFRIRRPSITKSIASLPTQSELDAFARAAGPGLKLIIRFKVETGATEYELLSLDWGHLNISRKRAILQRANGRVRVVAFSAALAEMLAKRSKNQTGRVFRTDKNGKPYTMDGNYGGRIKTAFNGASKRSGVKFTFQTLHRIWRARQGIGGTLDD